MILLPLSLLSDTSSLVWSVIDFVSHEKLTNKEKIPFSLFQYLHRIY